MHTACDAHCTYCRSQTGAESSPAPGLVQVVVDAIRSGPGGSSASAASIVCEEEDEAALLMPVERQ